MKTKVTCGLKIHTVPLWQPTVRGRRLGTVPLFSPKAGVWRLVPSYKFGTGTLFEWGEALPTEYATRRDALTARKELRSRGSLP